jgi:predicted membrane channel-forming protein YqfA (hemolysin III family)
MELSEYEQRKLDEIERALHRGDPGFAGSINIGAMRRHRRLVAAAVVLIGVLVLVVGAILAQGLPLVGVAVSVLGFVVMVAGAGLFLRGRPGPQINAPDGDTHRSRTRWSRAEDRFRRRFKPPDE